jgi:hypothetical protein
MPFLTELQRSYDEPRPKPIDPWTEALKSVRGTVDPDGVERISTQRLFDELEIRQRGRHTGLARRLARVMRGLGWKSQHVRDITRGGYKENVRGYCREARRNSQ